MRTNTRLQEVGEEEIPLPEPQSRPQPAPRRIDATLATILLTTLRTLSQRTIIALASLVDLALIGSAFALWVMVIANPTVYQLTGVGMYAVFILLAIWARRR